MAILDNIENLPNPVKYAGIAGAALGLLALAIRKSRVDQQQERVTGTGGASTPVVLPQGAISGGGSGATTYTNQANEELFAKYQQENATREANQQEFWKSIVELMAKNNAPTSPVPNPVDDQTATYTRNPDGTWTGAGNFPLGDPNMPLPAPTPDVGNPIPQPTPTPVSNPTAPQTPMDAGDSMRIGDLRAAGYITGIGKGVQGILDWLSGSKVKIYSNYTGNDWVSYGRAEKGWIDQNLNLYLPVAYNGTHDYGVGDYTNESYYARWARKTINIMQQNSNLSQKEAGLIALSNIKRDIAATSGDYYAGGFDFGEVPDNYGYGQYWR